MSLSFLISMLVFLWISAITPGPNNMLLTSSGAHFGYRRSFPLMLGIVAGMQTLLLLAALGVGSLLFAIPSLHIALKVVGSVYLFWLAWKMVVSQRDVQGVEAVHTPQQPVMWYQGWLLQFLNPKAWLMVLGMLGSFSLPEHAYFSSVWVMSVSLLLINLIAGFIWLGFGTFIGALLHDRRMWAIFNKTMGILTAVCVCFIWY